MCSYTKILSFISGILLVSCNEHKIKPEDFTGTLPVTADKDVTAFFEANLPPSSSSLLDCEFKFSSKTECFIIDSIDEFKDVSPKGVALPQIDFNRYSLVIGQVVLNHGGYLFERQSIDIQSDKVTLFVRYKELSGFYTTAFENFYFWGLYDKIPDLPFKLEIQI